MNNINVDDLFERRLTFPNIDAQKRFNNLVGIESIKESLIQTLSILVNPQGVKVWAEKFHKVGSERLIEIISHRPPLVILAGDVGTGKTELATTVGNSVARVENIEVTLFPLSLSTRGSGMVGEMTKLLSKAFEETFNFATKLKGDKSKHHGGVILLVDEADAIVQSRENQQMHHEDRAGVNAFIRGVDRLTEAQLPAVVILCTNRLSAIDPAVQRRAANIFTFERPNEDQRRAVLMQLLESLTFSKKDIDEIIALTGPIKGRDFGFTYSDITQRFLPSLILRAYPDSKITFETALEVLAQNSPTQPFNEEK